MSGKLSKTEDSILEYKSRDILAGRNEQIIANLSQDLKSKLAKARCKLYVVGTEDDGRLDPIPSSRLKSDRVETIRGGIEKNLRLTEIRAFPIIQQKKSILLIAALQS